MKNALTLALTLSCFCIAPALAAAGSRKKTVDPDDVYKNNCMRCHSAVRQYSPRMTATIVNHMRIRANLTPEETRAILEYLADSAPASTPAKSPSTAAQGGK